MMLSEELLGQAHAPKKRTFPIYLIKLSFSLVHDLILSLLGRVLSTCPDPHIGVTTGLALKAVWCFPLYSYNGYFFFE